MPENSASPELVAQLVRQALEEKGSVEIDGLGTFTFDTRHGFRFHAKRGPKVFIAYVTEDRYMADRLFDALFAAGFEPWLDRRKLVPGQNWPHAIEHALETADFVLTCFSSRAVRKKGGFQAELRFAFDCAARLPLDDIFLVPVRFNECDVPDRIRRVLQYVDLFPDFDAGFRRIVRVLKGHYRPRAVK